MASWENYDDGKSLGEKGSEGGIILKDEEYSSCARITLEKGGYTAPFAITIGVYFTLLHTHFCKTIKDAENEYMIFKNKIKEITDMDIERADEESELVKKLIDYSYEKMK